VNTQDTSWQAMGAHRTGAPKCFRCVSPSAVAHVYGPVMVGRGTPLASIDNGRPWGLGGEQSG
jgi:hypothetical protein